MTRVDRVFLWRRVAIEANAAMIGPGDEDPAALADRKLLWQQSQRAMGRLSDQEQAVLLLHYLRGATTSEIAVIMGITESRVSQVHRRALECLRTRMRRFGEPR